MRGRWWVVRGGWHWQTARWNREGVELLLEICIGRPLPTFLALYLALFGGCGLVKRGVEILSMVVMMMNMMMVVMVCVSL